MALPVGFAWSLLGFAAAQVYLQQQQQHAKGGKTRWLSPLLAGAVAANVGVAWHASIMGWGYLGGLSRFYAGEVRLTGFCRVQGLGVEQRGAWSGLCAGFCDAGLAHNTSRGWVMLEAPPRGQVAACFGRLAGS